MDVLQELRKASKAPKMSAVIFLKNNLEELRGNSPLNKQQLHQLAELVDKQTKAGYEAPIVKKRKEAKVPKMKLAEAPIKATATKKKAAPKKAASKRKSKPKS